MKTLIVEDDFSSRLLLMELLKTFGPVHIAINGKEAVRAVELALAASQPYDLICMDIMMPEMNGQTALRQIRDLEEGRGIWSSHGAKIIMVTGVSNIKNVHSAYDSLCDEYLVKPIDAGHLLGLLRKMGLLPAESDVAAQPG